MGRSFFFHDKHFKIKKYLQGTNFLVKTHCPKAMLVQRFGAWRRWRFQGTNVR